MSKYLFHEISNTVHDLSYEQIRELYIDNKKEERKGREITASSYRGENYYTPQNNPDEIEKEILLRDPMTAGLLMQYPHGVIIEQSLRRNYYRGENQIFQASVPSLLRKLQGIKTLEEQELYRLVADMRIAEFSFLLNEFEHVSTWKHCDILYDALAQHYGLETGGLDITTDFNVAMFFATCYYDRNEMKWLPLTKKQTEASEEKQYGMIFHMPSYQTTNRWITEATKFVNYTNKIVGHTEKGEPRYELLEHPIYKPQPLNLIYPLGFQPFMRCHMQNGYGIYMRSRQPLQTDTYFEKLRFRHNEKLSQQVYDLMKGGELIFPHEGLRQAEFLIGQIARTVSFSERAFQYALERSHRYRIADADQCRQELGRYEIDGQKIRLSDRHPWKLSSGRRRRIDEVYAEFSLERSYGIMIIDRRVYPGGSSMFEPWMLMEHEDEAGVEDFKARRMTGCSNLWMRQGIGLLASKKQARPQDF